MEVQLKEEDTMTTKNRTTITKTTAATTNQAVEATPTEQAAQPISHIQAITQGQETPEQKVERLKKELADAKAVTKAVKQKTKTPCAKAGCKLFAMEGRADNMCSNHRPEWSKLSDEDKAQVAVYLSVLSPEVFTQLLGAHKVKETVWPKP